MPVMRRTSYAEARGCKRRLVSDCFNMPILKLAETDQKAALSRRDGGPKGYKGKQEC